MAALHAADVMRRPNPAVWAPTGDLRPAAAREIARRLKAGDQPDAIIADLGIGRQAGRRRCREIAKALGIPSPEERHAAIAAEVCRRFEAGQTHGVIAAAVGKTPAMISHILGRAGLRDRNLGLAASQVETIDRRLRAGHATQAIATDVGCARITVDRQRAALGIGKPAGPCACGRPQGHTGGCALAPDKIALVRERLIAGARVGQIARELGMSDSRLRRRYALPIINELVQEGVACRCGLKLGHRGSCTKQRTHRQEAVPEQMSKPVPGIRRGSATAHAYHAIRDRFQRGQSAKQIGMELNLNRKSVSKLIAHWQARSGAPVQCACGRLAGHRGGCLKNTPMALSKTWIAHMEELTRAGLPPAAIATRLDVAAETVRKHTTALRRQLAAEGKRCACGRPLTHRGACAQVEAPHRGDLALARAVSNALLSGLVDRDAAAKAGSTIAMARSVRKEFAPEQLARRFSAMRKLRGAATSLAQDRVMQKVQAAVPRKLDPALRDDVINELCLAVLEGQVAESGIKPAAKTYTSRALSEWQNHHGPRSLDERRGENGGQALVDLLQDDTSANLIDDIELGDGT